MKNKTTWIIVGIVLAVILLIVGIFAGANNKAVFLEEQINGAQANINVAEKRRVDLVYNLVDAVQAYHVISAHLRPPKKDKDLIINTSINAVLAIQNAIKTGCSYCGYTWSIEQR